MAQSADSWRGGAPFLLIGAKYVPDPASAAAGSEISLATRFGRTNMRAGVGGFALGSAAIVLLCLASVHRLRLGLWFVLLMVAPVVLVLASIGLILKS